MDLRRAVPSSLRIWQLPTESLGQSYIGEVAVEVCARIASGNLCFVSTVREGRARDQGHQHQGHQGAQRHPEDCHPGQ